MKRKNIRRKGKSCERNTKGKSVEQEWGWREKKNALLQNREKDC